MKFVLHITSMLSLIALPLLTGCGDEEGGGSGTIDGSTVPTYSFTGFVRTQHGTGLTNVTVTLTETNTGVTHSALTGDRGFWLIGNIPNRGNSFTIVPVLAGFDFTPPSYVQDLNRGNVANLNFTAISHPTITLTAPQADEIFTAGHDLIITWNAAGDFSAVNLLYGNALKQYQFIARDIPATPGQFTWTIPTSLNTGQYTIRIMSTNGLAVSESGPFVIRTE